MTIIKNQSGMSLIEVMIALVVFLVASTALEMSITQMYGNNIKNNARIFVDSNAHSFLAIVYGNESVLPSLNGATFTKGQSVPSNLSVFDNWWTTFQQTNNLVNSVSIQTIPSTCSVVPCQIVLIVSLQQSGMSPVITQTFTMQDGF